MAEKSKGMIQRSLEEVIHTRLAEESVILIEGPRAVGKSALLRSIAHSYKAQVIDLDDLATKDAVTADPATFTRGQPPVCIDEYQMVPRILDSIKAELNLDGSPGRFIITGSTRHDSLPQAAQALTGRLHTITIFPLTQSEISGTRKNLVSELFANPESIPTPLLSTTKKEQYIEKIVQGGFPSSLTRSTSVSRNRWIDDYVRLTLSRDIHKISKVRQAAVLEQVLGKLAGQTGQELSITKTAISLNQNKELVSNYTKLLEAVFLLYRLPGWGTTLINRSTLNPKIHITDSGVAARLLRLTSEKLTLKNATSLTELGHLLETFAVGELVRQASWLDGIAGVGHWRTIDGEEVDLVIERDDGAILAFEIKSALQIPSQEFAPMRKLRDKLGKRFIAGVGLYLGERSYNLEDRIFVMPLDRLWLP